MASPKRKLTDDQEAVVQTQDPAESVYTAAELVKNHRVLNTSHAIATVALRLAGVKEATVTEAKKIIEEFKNKEVK